MSALLALGSYWSKPPYEQSDFLICSDGVRIIGGGLVRGLLPLPESSMPETVYID